jgi:NAD(P)-dependent dehydrogenase (short-subunit alcohol dehydrogenase family)
LQRAAAALGAQDRVHAVQADVRRSEDAGRLVDAAVSRFGGLDVLVNNAGIGRFASVADMSLETGTPSSKPISTACSIARARRFPRCGAEARGSS